jgi:hypothetical protein
MPKPVELPDHLQRNFRTRWMESVLGAALVLLLVVAACAGGFVLIKAVWMNTKPAAGREPSGLAPVDTTPGDAQTTQPPQTEPTVFPSEPLPRPDRLVGGWDSRADDGSHSQFDFMADGTVVITSVAAPRIKAFWYVVQQQYDDLVIEVGPEFGAFGNFQLVLRFSGVDAFTAVRTVHRGITTLTDLRYVRVGPPRDWFASKPAAPVPALPAEPGDPSP